MDDILSQNIATQLEIAKKNYREEHGEDPSSEWIKHETGRIRLHTIMSMDKSRERQGWVQLNAFWEIYRDGNYEQGRSNYGDYRYKNWAEFLKGEITSHADEFKLDVKHLQALSNVTIRILHKLWAYASEGNPIEIPHPALPDQKVKVTVEGVLDGIKYTDHDGKTQVLRPDMLVLKMLSQFYDPDKDSATWLENGKLDGIRELHELVAAHLFKKRDPDALALIAKLKGKKPKGTRPVTHTKAPTVTFEIEHGVDQEGEEVRHIFIARDMNPEQASVFQTLLEDFAQWTPLQTPS